MNSDAITRWRQRVIIGVGVDIVSIPRMEGAISRWGERFLEKVFVGAEIEKAPMISPRRWEYFAGRFAAKEAFLKALGTGMSRGLTLKDVWTLNGPAGNPVIHFSSKVRVFCSYKGIKITHLSISHERKMAVAMVVLEG